MEDYSGLCMEVIELGREDVVAASGCPDDTTDITLPEIPVYAPAARYGPG